MPSSQLPFERTATASTHAKRAGALRREILSVQRDLLRSLQNRVREILGPDSPELIAYRQGYEPVFDDFDGPASKDELVQEAKAADLVYCGDYHTLLQAQKTNLKVLREVVGEREVILALEMVRAKDQRHVDDFLADRISEEDFLARIHYEKTWGFRWSHYRMFFDFAKAHRLRVVALNYVPRPGPHRILQRDAFAAQILARVIQESPKALVWTVFGDLHCAPDHLPLQVRRLLPEELQARREVLIFQNNKKLYFRLAQAGLHLEIDTVRLTKGRYCVLNTPPWIRLRTYLDHLENEVFCEDDWLEDCSGEGYDDYLHRMLEELSTFLGLEGPDWSDFYLLRFEDLGQRVREIELPEKSKTLASIRSHASSHHFLGSRVLAMARFETNLAAELAGQLMHSRVSGLRLRGRSPEDLFYLSALNCALGFFASLVLNPKRKTDYFKDHDLFLSRFKGKRLKGRRRSQRQISRRVVQHQRAADAYLAGGRWPRFSVLYQEDLELGFGISKALGRILGDKLFRGLMHGLISRSQIRELFRDPLEPEGSPRRRYLEWRRLGKRVSKPFDSKDEFF